jgi:hypothetical protein
MKNKKYYNVWTVPKYNRKSEERDKIKTLSTSIHNFHSNEKGVTNFFQEGKTIFFLNGLKKKAVVTKYSDFYMIISKYENKSFEEFPFKM